VTEFGLFEFVFDGLGRSGKPYEKAKCRVVIAKYVGQCLLSSMRNIIFSALLLASAFQTALGQTRVGAWSYIVENGEATITASTQALRTNGDRSDGSIAGTKP
jgi:hypothetical protein